MAESRWSDIAVAVTTALDAALTCDVFDGPATSGDKLTSYVCIGANAPDSLEPNAGQFSQRYRGLGPAATKDETGDIRCHISSWSGDNNLPALRVTVMDIFDDINAALRADQTLGLTGVRAPEIEVRSGSIMQGYTTTGARVDLPFVLSYITQV